jgi:hypothetical protein
MVDITDKDAIVVDNPSSMLAELRRAIAVLQLATQCHTDYREPASMCHPAVFSQCLWRCRPTP